MTQIVRACRACREILRESGYTVEEPEGEEGLDDCPFCGHRTGVKPVRISKGEEAQPRASAPTGEGKT